MNTFIVAEIGINHNGDLQLAKKLIDAAVVAGCDAVKFQKRTVDKVYTKEYLDSPRKSPWGETQRAQKEGLEFGKEEYDEIAVYCKQKGIEWYASAWDIESQRFLQQYDCKYNKVASAMLTNDELLEEIAREGKYTFIATGMSTLEEIDHAVAIFKKHNCLYELMHCNSTYPMPMEDANLRLIKALADRYKCKVGYSGHEAGTLVSACAVAAGAASIERHITLDRNMYGSDQKASIEPYELCKLVKNIRDIEKIMGTGNKVLTPAEEEVKKKLRGEATSELKKEWDSILGFPDLYIYGAAKTAEELYDFISQMGYKDNVKGFLVTNGESNAKVLCELLVSDIHTFTNKEVRVLVPHMGVYKEQISSLLESLAFKNVFLIGRLREKTSLEKRNFITSDYAKTGWEIFDRKSEEEKANDANIREEILNILQEGQPDFGGVKPYQSLELIGLEGMRPTEYRIRTYELRQILKESDDVLDIGCNSGFLDMSIAGLVHSVTGIEYDSSLVKVANLMAEYLNLSNCMFYNDDFNNWFKDADTSYNVIFSFAIHHWLDLDAMEYVAAINKLLKTGGYLCFESHIYGMDNEFDECYKEFLNLGYHVVCEKKIKDDGVQERMYVLFQKNVN